ncbi:hypothetical protein GTZ99_15730 [Novosphingobium sp. FSY-8]|uniref:Uncharacterized protein n=1 Tax=Novosphingobium ovatum TaxID=1908523 RepID=A0ABW9XHI2_9SPHN|nr:hypothetical protein [Novosphingobium ovatum]NBC38005.1 hypothetical protein [Novosphingobium ovatum]
MSPSKPPFDDKKPPVPRKPRRNGRERDDAQTTAALEAAAAATRCDCAFRCTALLAAQCLYRKTLDMLSRADIDAEQNPSQLLPPLAQLVARLKSGDGHLLAAEFAVALRDGDTDEMLDACHRIIDLTTRIEEEQEKRPH